MIGVDDGWSAADPTKNVYSTATPYNSPHLFGEAANPVGWVNLHAIEEAAAHKTQVAALTSFFAAEVVARAGREAKLNGAAGGGLFQVAAGMQPAGGQAGSSAPRLVAAAIAALLWIL